MSAASKKAGNAPYGMRYASWGPGWHKINGGASRTACGRLLPAEGATFSAGTPALALRCRTCFPPWERLT